MSKKMKPKKRKGPAGHPAPSKLGKCKTGADLRAFINRPENPLELSINSRTNATVGVLDTAITLGKKIGRAEAKVGKTQSEGVSVKQMLEAARAARDGFKDGSSFNKGAAKVVKVLESLAASA